MQSRPAKTEPVEDAGTVVFDQDIGLVDQLQQRRLVVGLLQVQHNRPLVAVPGHEWRAFAIDEGRHAAGGIALRRLDLDDLGAMVGQQHRAVRAREVAGQVQDQKVIESAGHGVFSVFVEEMMP